MVKLPQLKKAVHKFLTDEDGKISKKALLSIGSLIALAAAFSQKVRAADCQVVSGNVPLVSTEPLPPGFTAISANCQPSYPFSVHDNYNWCEVDITAWCHEVTHSNMMEVRPTAGEIIATHNHAVGTQAKYYAGHWWWPV